MSRASGYVKVIARVTVRVRVEVRVEVTNNKFSCHGVGRVCHVVVWCWDGVS